jgi:hypothetical protein
VQPDIPCTRHAPLSFHDLKVALSSKEESLTIQELLATYRRTQIHYRKQQAVLGAAYALPGVAEGARKYLAQQAQYA